MNTPRRAPVSRVLVGWSLLALLLCAVQARVVLGGVPHVQDELAYLLQARIFADGARTAAPPADGLLVATDFVAISPRWYGIFPIGWPLVLALGALAGLPWVVNPLLAAALPWLAWAAFHRLLPRSAALAAVGVAACSPGLVALGGSMMSHTLALCCALGGLAAVQEGGRFGGKLRALAGGLAVGLMLLARPFEGALLGLPLCALALARWRDWRWLLCFGLGPALGLGLTLVDNAKLTGSALVFPVDIYFRDGTAWGQTFPPGCNRLGLGADRGCLGSYAKSGHTVGSAVAGLGANAWHFDQLFLGFPGSGLIVVAGLVVLARRPGLRGLLWPAAAIPLGYSLYWYHGVAYGARFWSGVYVAALPAAGLALTWPERRWAWWPGRWLPLVGLVVGVPRLWAELADDYWCVDGDLARTVATRVERGVVLMQDGEDWQGRWPLTKHNGLRCDPWLSGDAGLGQNDPRGTAITWLRDPGDGLEEVLARHAGEEVWELRRSEGSGAWSIWRWGAGWEEVEGQRTEGP